MSNFTSIIKFPDGSCARTYTITGVIFDGDSIKVQGSGYVITTIEVECYEDRQRVMDLINECMKKGKKAVQPDWSFLSKSAKPDKK